MIYFVTSLNKGLELAQQADENKKEIDDVFAELNRQLNQAYAGKLVIEREFINEGKGILKIPSPLIEEGNMFKRENRDAKIVAKNPAAETSPPKPLVNWSKEALAN